MELAKNSLFNVGTNCALLSVSVINLTDCFATQLACKAIQKQERKLKSTGGIDGLNLNTSHYLLASVSPVDCPLKKP
jgi:hypothetical protein